MKLRGLLVGAAVALAATAMTSAATLAHAATPAVHKTSAATTTINLSSEYSAALKAQGTRTLGMAGMVRPLGYHAKAAVPAACKEPNCKMTYHGGLIQTKPTVYLLFWGPKWSSSTYASEGKYLVNLYKGLAPTSDHWGTSVDQYKGKNGHPTTGIYKAAYQDKTAPPSTVSQGSLAAEATAFAKSLHIGGSNLEIVIASQEGTCFSPAFAGNCGHVDNNGQYCAYHSATNSASAGGISYTNLPYQLDAGSLCGEGWHGSHLGGFSVVGGHEWAESVTDPYPASGWIDLADQYGGENGDKCAWGGVIWGGHDPAGYVTLSTGKFMMQSLWSNAADKCVM